MSPKIHLRLRNPHTAQAQVFAERGRFNVVCAGRRWGKTEFGIERSAETMLGNPAKDIAPGRVGFFSPSYKVLAECWRDVSRALRPATARHNDTEHRLELLTGGSLEMWTLQDKDAGRSRFYDRVFVDEAAMVPGLIGIWNEAIRSTLMQTGGDAWFFSTPKGRNDFMTMWQWGQAGDKHIDGWQSWRFPSGANPYLPAEEIEAMRLEMPRRAFEQEVEAKFIDEVEGALWKQTDIDAARLSSAPPLTRVVVGIDPAGSTNRTSDETGIVCVGSDANKHGYVLADASGTYSPDAWARKAIGLYQLYEADCIVAEANFGGDMVRHTLKTVDPFVPVKIVHAARGKAIRAEPIAAAYEQGRVHHVGTHDELELQMTTWSPAEDTHSPDHVDALVWALSEFMLGTGRWSIDQINAYGRNEVLGAEPAPSPTEPTQTDRERYVKAVEQMNADAIRNANRAAR